jgi:hypothetical protein
MRSALLGSLASLTISTLVYAAPPTAVAPPATVDGPVADRVALIRPAPVPERVATSETIITGKVTSIEEKTVKAASFPGADDKVEYIVAVVKVDDAVLGAKGLTHVKVGFMAPQAGKPGGPIRPGLRGQAKLEKDQEVLLFLSPHHSAEFQIMPAYFDVVDKSAPTYEKDLETAKKCVKLLAEPEKGLKSKDAQERLETAAILVAKYRSYKPSTKQPKEEAIDADMSKRIMNVLAEADWTPPKPGGPFAEVSAINVFSRLNISPETEKSFKPPMDGNKYMEYVQTWVKDNKDKYRIKELVYEKIEKKDDKKEPNKEK